MCIKKGSIFPVIIFAMLMLIGFSCNKKKKLSNQPKLTFNKLSTNSVQAGSEQVVQINVYFEDGDGNIGFGTNNLFLKDSRDTLWVPYMIPQIPEKFNPDNGLKGMLQVNFEAVFLLLRPDSIHQFTDTLSWEIYMLDQAGNKSNTVFTTPLVLTK